MHSLGWYCLATAFVCMMLKLNPTELHECDTVWTTGVSLGPDCLSERLCNLETRQDNHLDINTCDTQREMPPFTPNVQESVRWGRIYINLTFETQHFCDINTPSQYFTHWLVKRHSITGQFSVSTHQTHVTAKIKFGELVLSLMQLKFIKLEPSEKPADVENAYKNTWHQHVNVPKSPLMIGIKKTKGNCFCSKMIFGPPETYVIHYPFSCPEINRINYAQGFTLPWGLVGKP